MSIAIVLTSLLIFILFNQLAKKQTLQHNRNRLETQFGKKTDSDMDSLEEISIYWNECGSSIADDEKIDDVTWNDLNMDEVYGRINSCCSFAGEQYLFSRLHTLPKNERYGTDLEGKIEALTADKEERLKIQMLLLQLGKNNLGYYIPMFIQNLENNRIGNIRIFQVLQILLFVSVLPPLIFMKPVYFTGTAAVFLINLVLYTINKTKYEIFLSSLYSIIQLVKVGEKLVSLKSLKANENFTELEQHLAGFKKLTRLVSGIQKKKSASLTGDAIAMVYDYLIGATLWDFTVYDKVCTILDRQQNEYMHLYEMIGEIDAAIAIASFRQSLPHFCLPVFVENGKVEVTDIYHPLIDTPVCNSLNIPRSCLITGSNASGKSTFIKAVAVNIVLAQNIHTCMAQNMVLPHTWVITSMAVKDNLMSGESYYIKEIKYLNRIIQSLNPDRFIFCAIDEILKGTNAEERIHASYSILNYISEKNCLALVATHDKELTALLKTFDNYHFEEEFCEHDIKFDYKIRNGVSTTRNAIKLLEYVGFPDEIIKNAKDGIS